MAIIPKSGLYIANKHARIMIEAIEGLMGKNGLNAVLNLAGLPDLIDHYPPDQLERQFDFADLASILQALEDLYGPRGGRGLALRAGRAAFSSTVHSIGALAGMQDPAFQKLDLNTRLRLGVPVVAKIYNQTCDQVASVQDRGNELAYVIQKCPVCWGRKEASEPICILTAGMLQEALKWISGGNEFKVQETTCCAKGDPACTFTIQKEPIR